MEKANSALLAAQMEIDMLGALERCAHLMTRFGGHKQAAGLTMDASRIRDGMYWSGDLGYADSDGFCWFAGRAGQWLRVDGENLGTAPIERALLRHPAIAEAAVYGVPDPVAGDQVMACIVVRGGASPLAVARVP